MKARKLAKPKPATPLSRKSFDAECAKHGVTPPKSLAKTSEEFNEWLRVHGDNLPFAAAIRDYRSANALLKKLQTMRDLARPDGTMPTGIRYCAAHTMRDGGGDGLINVQNFSRTDMFGIDVRGLIAAPEGFTFGVVDEAQIEARVLLWLAGDHETLELIATGMSIYEAHARQTMGYKDPGLLAKTDKKLYALAKARVLALGFGCGPDKFKAMAKTLAGLDLSQTEAESTVWQFRKSNPKITDLWEKLDFGLLQSAGGDYTVESPDGSSMTYRDIKMFGGGSGVVAKFNNMMRVKLYGGLLAENITQHVARQIFMLAILRCHQAGYPAVLRAHDEGLFLLDERTAPADLKQIIHLFEVRPDWAADLPISAEGCLTKKYKK